MIIFSPLLIFFFFFFFFFFLFFLLFFFFFFFLFFFFFFLFFFFFFFFFFFDHPPGPHTSISGVRRALRAPRGVGRAHGRSAAPQRLAQGCTRIGAPPRRLRANAFITYLFLLEKGPQILVLPLVASHRGCEIYASPAPG